MPQQEVVLKCQLKHRVVTGGNRSGKSAVAFADDALVLIRRHPYRQWMYPDMPIQMRIIGTDFDRGIEQTAVPYMKQYIPPSFLINGAWESSYSPSSHMLTLADGSTCSFMSFEQDANKFQSVALMHVHMDEEPPLAIWQESMLRLLDYGGTWMLSQTPVTQSEWIDDLVVTPARAEQDEPGARIAVFDLLTEQNTHLDQDAVAEVQIGMTEEQKAIRMRGEYTGTDKVFPKFTGRYPFVIDHEAFLRAFNTRDWVVYRSMDHGLKNPTAWIWTAVHRNGGIVTFRVLYAAGVDLDTWARRVKEADMEVGEMLGLGHINTWEPAGCFGDPSIIRKDQATVAITSIQQEYAMRGVPISVQGIAAARGQSNQNIGLAKINGYLQLRPASVSPVTLQPNEPQWQVTDWHDGRAGFEYADNLHLVSEVQRARVPAQSLNNKQNHNVIEQIRDKDNHAIDAVKYLFMALPQINGAFTGGQLDDHTSQDMMAAMGDHGWRMAPAASRLVLPTSTTPGYYGDPDLGMNL